MSHGRAQRSNIPLVPPSIAAAAQEYATPRRYPRMKIDVPLRIIAQRADKMSIVHGRGNELNEGGIAAFAGIEVRIGEQVWVEFTPPYSGGPIRVRGIVRDRTGYKYGIEFLAATIQEHDQVDHLRAVLHSASGHRAM
jgi:PilZ domain-containing protein